jgi:RND family efflux transporter MFP subunit
MTATSDQSTDNKWTKRLSRKGWIILITLISLMAILIIWLVFSTKTAPDKATNSSNENSVSQPKPALTVTVVSPEQQSWEQTFTANGNVAAWQEVVIGSELSGQRLQRVNVNVGDVVRRGQVLAEINSDTIRAELAAAKASLAEAQAVLADAAANNKRIQQLKNTGAISAQEAAQYQTTQFTAQARLDAARAQIDSNQLRLAQTQVISPDNGVISARTATVGSLAQTGQELFRLIRNNRLEWRAEVTTTDLYKLKEGMNAKIYSPDPNQPPIIGKVRMIAPVIDPQTRYGLVYVDFPQNNAIRMGMFVKGAFDLGQKSALTVPQSALLLRDGFSYVFIVNKDNRVTQQKVTLGRRLGDRVEITDLAANVKVISTGTGFLTDGDLVKVAAVIPDTPLSKQLVTGSVNGSTTDSVTSSVNSQGE